MSDTPDNLTVKAPKEFIVLMALLMSLVAISIDAFLPALGIVGQDLSLSNPNHAQYLVSFIFLGLALGELVAGPLSDAFGRKPILFAGVAIYIVGALVCYFADDLTVMLCGRLLQGLGVAGPYIASVSIVRDKYSGRHMAKVMSVVMMIFIMVPAIAPSLGQAIMMAGSWRMIFLMYVAYALLATVWIFLRLDESLPVERRIPFKAANIMHNIREIVSNHATRNYTICTGIIFGSLIGYLNSSQQIFQVQFGAGGMFTIYFGILALTIGVSSMLNSRFVERLGMRYICIRAFMCIIAASAAFLALHAVAEIKLWMFMLYAATLFFSFGLMFGNLNALALEPMGHIAGTASAFIAALSSLLSIALGSIIGQLYNNTLIPITTGFMILGIIALFFMYLADKKPQEMAA